MKRFAMVGVAWLGALLTAAAAGPIEPLFSNDSFEMDHSNRGWPDGWGSPGRGKTWPVENGHHFLRLTALGPDQMQMLYRLVKITPEAVKALDFNARYRLSAASGEDSPLLLLIFKDHTGRLLGHESLSLDGEARQWAGATKKFRLPEGTAQVSIIVGWPKGGEGSLDIASLSITPIETTQDLTPLPERLCDALPINGDFAKADASDQWPDGWGEPAPGMTWNRDEGFIRLVSQKPGVSLMLDRKIPLKAGMCGLEVAIRSRTSGVLHGEHEWFDARTIIHFLGADGKILPSEKSLDMIFTHKPAPTDWIERVQFLRVPEGATTLELRPGLFLAKAGTVDLASLAIHAVNEEDCRLLQIAADADSIGKGEENAEADRNFETLLQAQLAATGNLVANGTFEAKGADATWPDEWGKAPPAGLSWSKEGKCSFVRLESKDETRIVMLYKMVPLTSGAKNIDVTFRYRTAGIVHGTESPGDARVAMHFLNGTRIGHLENGRNMEPDPEPILFSANANDWTKIIRRLVAPEGATKLQLMPGLWKTKTGILDLSEIRVTPAEPEPQKSPASNTPE
ncbi:hypothetical protein BH09VER1_BH09VER1_46600 [soil metagenome]